MVEKISFKTDYSYLPFTNIRIGGEKVDCFDDGSEKRKFYGLNKIIHKIKTLASRT